MSKINSSPQVTLEAAKRGEDADLAARPLILVAEDNSFNQEIIVRQLDLLGYGAEVASDGAVALRLWRDGRHALVLTDIEMPHLDGHGLSRAIRVAEALPPTRARVPILALTASAACMAAPREPGAAIDEYFSKPVELEILGAALRRWLLPQSAIPEGE